MTFMFLGDVVYMFADLNLIPDMPDRCLDLPYALAFLGAGAGALHPSMRRLTERTRQTRMRVSAGPHRPRGRGSASSPLC